MRTRLAVAAAALLSHATALLGGFVWLDHGDLEAGAALAPPARWLALFARPYARTGFYRPLTALSLSVDALARGAWAFHLSSMLWHALAAVLVTFAAEALGLTRRAALLAGALFAVHPVTGLVVGVATYRADLLVACALFGLVVAHRAGRPVLAGLCVAAGGLAKETALPLAPLWVAILELAGPRTKRRSVFAAEAGGLALALGLRAAFAPAWRTPQPPLALSEHVGTRLAALAKSAAALLLPRDRSICDAFPLTPLASWGALAGLAVVAALALLAWRRSPAGLLLAAALAPSLQLVPAPRFWSPHYLYLPLAFLAMLAGALADRFAARGVAAACAAGALLGAVTLSGGRRFASDEALFAPEVARAQCREARLYLGDARREAGDLDAAARLYEEAAAPAAPGWLAYSDEGAALQNLGLVRLEERDYAAARSAFAAALAKTVVERDRRRVTHDLAAAAFAQGDAAEAARLLAPEADRPDAMPESLLLMSRALDALGEPEEAARLAARARSKP